MSKVNFKKILLDISKHKLSLEEIFKDINDEIAGDETFFRNAVKLNGDALKYASDVIRDNKEIVMSAVKSSCWSLKHASDRLKIDKDVVMQSLKDRSDLYYNHLVFPEQLLTNRDFVLKLIQTNSYNINFIPNDLRDDEMLYAYALAGDSSILNSNIKAFDDETYNKLFNLLENKEIVTEVILKNIYVFNYLSVDLKKNEPFIINLINRLSELTQFGGYDTVSRTRKQKRDLLDSIIKINNNNERVVLASLRYTIDDANLGELIFNNIAQDLYNNAEFILRAMEINGYLFRYIPANFKNNKAVILSALNNQLKTKSGQIGNESPLKYASDSLRDDMDVVMAAIQNDGKAISHVSDRLKNNVNLVLESLKHGAGLNYFKYLPLELQNRKNLLLALKNGGGSLSDVPINLRSDKEIVMLSVMDNGKNLRQASIELKNDKEIVLVAVKSYGEVLEYASDELRNDPDIVLAAVSQNGAALKFASEELKNNREIALKSVRNKHAYILNSALPALAYIGNNLKDDKEIILESLVHVLNGYYIFENELVPTNLLYDKDFVINLIEKNKENFIKYYWKFLPSKIKNDLDIFTMKLMT